MYLPIMFKNRLQCRITNPITIKNVEDIKQHEINDKKKKQHGYRNYAASFFICH